jgi:sugar phosphate isomerase/epimerase
MLYGAMNFPVKPVLEELESIAGLGFDYFELTMDPPQAHYTQILQQLDAIRKKLDRLEMELVCHLPSFLSTADLTPGLREASVKEMISSLEVAAELNPMKVVLHPSYSMGLGPLVPDLVAAYALQSLTAAVEAADRLGVVLCLENMFPRANSLVEPEDFADVFERFPTLKLTLDTGHANIGSRGGKRVRRFIERFPERIGHVHASDNLGKDDNHLPIGAGNIDFRKIVRSFKAIGYDETITLEIFSGDRDYLRISREILSAMIQRE